MEAGGGGRGEKRKEEGRKEGRGGGGRSGGESAESKRKGSSWYDLSAHLPSRGWLPALLKVEPACDDLYEGS